LKEIYSIKFWQNNLSLFAVVLDENYQQG